MKSWEQRRAAEWSPHDPNRGCYGCGEPPIRAYPDGSPQYRPHSHPVVTATPEETLRYAAQRPLVVLTDVELARARAHAKRVMEVARQEGYRHNFVPENELRIKTRAYASEIAVAKHLGLPWNAQVFRGVVRRKPADVGSNIEVRTWRGRGLYCPIRDGDPARRVIVLAVGEELRFELIGWLIAKNGMREEWRYDDSHRSPYWRVPISALRLFPIPPSHLR